MLGCELRSLANSGITNYIKILLKTSSLLNVLYRPSLTLLFNPTFHILLTSLQLRLERGVRRGFSMVSTLPLPPTVESNRQY